MCPARWSDSTNGGTVPSDSDFLPAERLEPGQVLAQAGEIARSPALVAMLDTVPALVALLNPER